jgi:hypothetical protein
MTTARSPYVVSFGEVGSDWIEIADGLFCNTMFIGKDNDPDSPAFEIVKAGRDVGDRIAGLRTHSSACFAVVVEGTVQLDGRWLGVGDIEVVPPGVPHGDTVVGPDGAVFTIMFGQRSGMVPAFVDAGDQKRFDQLYRADVEAVASGKTEKTVALLPARDTYTPRRGVGITDPDEVARLMTAAQNSH